VEVILHTNHGGRQRTPLLLAAYIGNVLVVCLLLNKGANIHAMDCVSSIIFKHLTLFLIWYIYYVYFASTVSIKCSDVSSTARSF
jgi:hypothetical protein